MEFIDWRNRCLLIITVASNADMIFHNINRLKMSQLPCAQSAESKKFVRFLAHHQSALKVADFIAPISNVQITH